ncbi:General amino acid permease [Wickerhamomyces ciferrii]|uniref:General amino acid permease n=1 Tax=Wickerhamomyces ciferrii (strain ATCC 14091 / BCRC 22168 / CBS 111 / JCM 3599 / NBRC 0793 / NRRL Y-1031 F-60-10) TaxID=1206466 RepID=K0KL45_WICCF|nr:General amino acid permease [Wickerhamomyces ciferrii]CCH41818.1 General amino acid permease [Wickerhamomyces ciferrii]
MVFARYGQPEVDIENVKSEAEVNSFEKRDSSYEQQRHESSSSDDQSSIKSTETHSTHRTLTSRTVNLIALGGSIGTGLFVTISSTLMYGGPLGLLLSYMIWSLTTFCVIVSIGEMVTYLPINAPFIQMAGRCVDEAFEVVTGFNYYVMISIYIPFEITAVNSMIHFWRDDYSPAISFCIQIFIYTVLNVFAVKWFGESEFYLTIGKVVLAVGLIVFTFVTMVGGNPQHDAFGFRNWNNPGPFVEYLHKGTFGEFTGFFNALTRACFTIVGPEYLAMVAGETGQETRKVLASSFRTVFYRMAVFYILGALSVGILLASNDPTLLKLAGTDSASNGNFSPYVIAMKNMNIQVLPHIVNVLCVLSTFSAGNSYVYCSSRALLAMAQRGFAPKFFQYCTKDGVPIFCVGVAFLFSLLSLLQLGDGAAKVLNWIINVVTSAQIANYFFMTITYIHFWRACNKQGLDRSKFLYKSYFQPYTTIFPMIMTALMIITIGYATFIPGNFTAGGFLTNYLMILLDIVIFIVYKLVKRTKFVKPEEADLVSGLDEVTEHERRYIERMEKSNKYNEKPTILQSIYGWIF